MKYTIVGIAGITNSGKTVLSTKLKEMYPNAIHIMQDDYFLSENDPRHIWVKELGHVNWEILSSLDIEKMLKDIDNILRAASPSSQSRILLLDGFLLFSDSRIASLCDLKFFVDIDYETCLARRLKRAYDPPDVPGYFERIVWPEAVKSRSEIVNKYSDIVFLDGTKPVEELMDIIVNTLNERNMK